MQDIYPYLGDLHDELSPHWAGLVLVFVSVLCGMIVGAERQIKQKSAGTRTLTLICVGSTIFTLASILLAGGSAMADRTRIAAQVVTGVGFLGAGAIIRHRGAVVGLTTGATIWGVAAIGVLVGGGYAAAGIVLTLLVVGMLVAVQKLERSVLEPCQYAECKVVYNPESGKTRLRLLRVLDDYKISDGAWQVYEKGNSETMTIRYCHYHRGHRSLLFEIVEIPGVVEIARERAPRQSYGSVSSKKSGAG